jgi:hypothetical protein
MPRKITREHSDSTDTDEGKRRQRGRGGWHLKTLLPICDEGDLGSWFCLFSLE